MKIFGLNCICTQFVYCIKLNFQENNVSLVNKNNNTGRFIETTSLFIYVAYPYEKYILFEKYRKIFEINFQNIICCCLLFIVEVKN